MVAPQLVADRNRYVDGKNAGQRLRHCKQVKKIFLGNPAVLVDNLLLDNGYHGPSAAKRKRSYLEKRYK